MVNIFVLHFKDTRKWEYFINDEIQKLWTLWNKLSLSPFGEVEVMYPMITTCLWPSCGQEWCFMGNMPLRHEAVNIMPQNAW